MSHDDSIERRKLALQRELQELQKWKPAEPTGYYCGRRDSRGNICGRPLYEGKVCTHD